MRPFVSVVPNSELGESHDGARMEYLIVPEEARTRNLNSDGEKGPPWGPEPEIPLDGSTINEAPAGDWAVANHVGQIAIPLRTVPIRILTQNGILSALVFTPAK